MMLPARRPGRRPRRPGQPDLRLVTGLPLEFAHRPPTFLAATILEAAAAAVRSSGLTGTCSVMGVAPRRQPRCGTCIYCRIRAAADEVFPAGVDPDAVVVAHQAAEDHGLHVDPRATAADAYDAVIAAAYDLFHVTLPPDVRIARIQ